MRCGEFSGLLIRYKYDHLKEFGRTIFSAFASTYQHEQAFLVKKGNNSQMKVWLTDVATSTFTSNTGKFNNSRNQKHTTYVPLISSIATLFMYI
jgi:hypothetical protein